MKYDMSFKTMNALAGVLGWFDDQDAIVEHNKDLASLVNELREWWGNQPIDVEGYLLEMKENDPQQYNKNMRRIRFLQAEVSETEAHDATGILPDAA